MLKLDRNDPLDRMLLKELSGSPVLFDEWLDAMDKLADEPDCEQILRERGLDRKAVLREAQKYRADFRARLAERELPVYDRFTLCRQLSELAKAAPDFALLQIFCEVLCDPGFLLDHEPEAVGEEEQEEEDEQVILQYLSFMEEWDELFQTLLRRGELVGKFAEAAKQKRSPRSADCATERKYEVFRCFTELYDMPPKGDGRILLDNLAAYMQIAAASPALRSVEPLLLFRLLTRRQSYMCGTPDLVVDLSAIWKPDHNKIDADNGRNFRQYRTNLQLFTHLCQIYERDSQVDIPLCWYGLDQITVLGDFYRKEISKGWEYADSETDLAFIPTIEELVEDRLFSCFENGQGDNVMLNDSGLPLKDLLRFQSSTDPIVISALERISDYMNSHALDLTKAFLHADLSEMRFLCRTILEKSCIRRSIPAHELPFYLASINEGLMELQDYFASQYLILTGYALTDTPLTKSPARLE